MVLPGDHLRLLYPIDCAQRGLHLTEFDPISADLDLLVGTAEIPQFPVGAPAHQIAGAIHPRPGRPERARHKPRRTQPAPTDISVGQSGAGHIQLANHAYRCRPQQVVQHEEAEMCQRYPDRADRAPNVGVEDLPE